jgi:hypothetical protein
LSWRLEWDNGGALESLRYFCSEDLHKFLILGDALAPFRSGRSFPLQFFVMRSLKVVAHVAKPLVAGGELLDDLGARLEGVLYEFDTVSHPVYPFAVVA